MEQTLLSSRANGYPPSPIRKLLPYARAAEQAGHKVFYLNIGEPDLPTPPVFLKAMQSYQSPIIAYAPSQGHPQLLQAIQTYFKQDGYDFDLMDIQVTQGATDALLFAFFVTCNPGDHILTPEPFYPNYLAFTRQMDIILDGIPTVAENQYALPSEAMIESLITPKTRAILIANPSNPSGRVYRKEELQRLVNLAKKHHLWLIGDELYRKMTFKHDAISFAAFPEVSQQIILVDSVSKRYSACGARIGCLISRNKHLMHHIHRLGQSRLGVSLLDQIGASALYALPTENINWTRDQYIKRRDIVMARLSQHPEIKYVMPEGAFYLMMSLPIQDSEAFALWLIEQFHFQNQKILVTPGKDFYVNPTRGKQEVRIAFVLDTQELDQAMTVFFQGLQAYLAFKG
jgi:aspartate aminotransferase